MLAFLRPFESIEAISKARESLKKTTGGFLLSGVSDAEKCHVIYGACHDVKKTLIVTFDEMKAAEICEEYSFFNPETYLYPGKDLLFYQSDIRGNALEKKRLTAIKALLSEPEVTIVTTFDALMNKMAPMELLKGKVILISTGDAVDMEELSVNLVTMGYEKVSQTENPGEFAVRGGIIDIFPLTEDHPFRIELWGDEVDSIRSFDEMTQKSVENLDMAEIFPAAEYVIDEDTWENGLSAMREDAISLAKTYREEMKTEAAYHIETLLR
ncbi:MAG: transcription-repair coupling factor, partial [Lachnospiraceae bacterium]|nr:transcription-repair coupling factor [Lachnospiraceae bacterium]